MQSNEIQSILQLQEQLGRRIVGQAHALEAVAQAIRANRAGLTDPRKPVGVFLMVGTSRRRRQIARVTVGMAPGSSGSGFSYTVA